MRSALQTITATLLVLAMVGIRSSAHPLARRKESCEVKKHYDPQCYCDVGNLGWIVPFCPVLPSCRECGIECKLWLC